MQDMFPTITTSPSTPFFATVTSSKSSGSALSGPSGGILYQPRIPALGAREVANITLRNISQDIVVAVEDDEQEIPLTEDWLSLTLALFYLCVFAVGVIGNVSVLASLCRRSGQPQGHRHALLLSLAAADLLITLVCLPPAAMRLLTPSWPGPAFLCPVLSASQYAAHGASTLSLSHLALDRYLTVRRPKLAPRVSSITGRLLAGTWVFVVLLAAPRGIVVGTQAFYGSRTNFLSCKEEWPFPVLQVVYHAAVVLVLHVLPFTVVALCHTTVALSLRHQGLGDTKLSTRPRQVIIMARDRSVVGIPNQKMVPASSSVGDSDEGEGEDRKQLEAELKEVTFAKHRKLPVPKRAPAPLKPARSIKTIIRAHRKLRIRRGARTSSILASYRAHSVETRRRLANLLLWLIAIFVVCWMPYVIAVLCWACQPSPATEWAVAMCLVLGHTHSAVNPIVYWLMNRSFLLSVQRLCVSSLKWPSLSCTGCAKPACISRPPPRPWVNNSSTNEDNLGPFHPKYLNHMALRPQASRCTSHYFH
ncbi:cholecystokinin receptor type A isoform X2 [Oratosquilla oratoria]